MIDNLKDIEELIGWPVEEIVEKAAKFHINVKIIKSYRGRRATYYSVEKNKGDILISVEDGKIMDIQVVV